jgi:small-conductance mechanosensitive channel
MTDWLADARLFGIPLISWLLAALIALGGYLIVHTLVRALARHLDRLSGHRSDALAAVSSALHRTRSALVFVLFAVIGLGVLDLPAPTQTWLDRLAFLVAGLQIGLWTSAAIRSWTVARLADGEPETNRVVTAMLGWFARILVWATLLLAVLANMGVNITAMVASLGIGGVAVALALQNVLGDLFASLSIGLDQPFVIGEFIQFGDFLGTITHVGVKTTRIRSLSGEEIAIGNANLLAQTIRNYSRMATRRIVFNFGIAMDTPREKLQQVIDDVREIVGAIDGIALDRAHFKGFGDSSFDFEVVYIVQSAEYNIYMDIQQRINLALVERFEARGVPFAIPTSKLRVARAGKP